MFEQVVTNVVANLITTVILSLLAAFIYFLFYARDRQQLLRFFGVNKSLPRIRIYVTRMEIKPGGTSGFEPVSKGYSGAAIAKVDYDGAVIVGNLLRSLSLTFLPQRLQDWLGQQNVTLLALDPSIDTSPLTIDSVPTDNLITLGTGIYNLVSKHFFEHTSSFFLFTKNDQGERIFRIRRGGLKGTELLGRSDNKELGIIQRIIDTQNNRIVFMCAGLGSSATYGSARYLAKNWKQLQRKYGNKEFGLCLSFSQQQENSEIVVEPIVTYEISDNIDARKS